MGWESKLLYGAPKFHPSGSNASLLSGMQKLFFLQLQTICNPTSKTGSFQRTESINITVVQKEDRIQILLDSSYRAGNIKVVILNNFFSFGFDSDFEYLY